MEQQLKKVEAAQRRRMQVEKAARESEVCSLHHNISIMNRSYPFDIVPDGSKPVRRRQLERYSVKIQAERSGKIKRRNARKN